MIPVLSSFRIFFSQPLANQNLHKQSLDLLNNGFYSKAYESITDAINKEPDNPLYLLIRGRIQLQNSQFDPDNSQTQKIFPDYLGATKDLEESIRLVPSNALATSTLGLCFYQQEKYDQALQFAKLALAQIPNDPDTNLLFAKCLESTNEKDQAIDSYLTTLKSLKKFPPQLENFKIVEYNPFRYFADSNQDPEIEERDIVNLLKSPPSSYTYQPVPTDIIPRSGYLSTYLEASLRLGTLYKEAKNAPQFAKIVLEPAVSQVVQLAPFSDTTSPQENSMNQKKFVSESVELFLTTARVDSLQSDYGSAIELYDYILDSLEYLGINFKKKKIKSTQSSIPEKSLKKIIKPMRIESISFLPIPKKTPLSESTSNTEFINNIHLEKAVNLYSMASLDSVQSSSSTEKQFSFSYPDFYPGTFPKDQIEILFPNTTVVHQKMKTLAHLYHTLDLLKTQIHPQHHEYHQYQLSWANYFWFNGIIGGYQQISPYLFESAGLGKWPGRSLDKQKNMAMYIEDTFFEIPKLSVWSYAYKHLKLAHEVPNFALDTGDTYTNSVYNKLHKANIQYMMASCSFCILQHLAHQYQNRQIKVDGLGVIPIWFQNIFSHTSQAIQHLVVNDQQSQISQEIQDMIQLDSKVHCPKVKKLQSNSATSISFPNFAPKYWSPPFYINSYIQYDMINFLNGYIQNYENQAQIFAQNMKVDLDGDSVDSILKISDSFPGSTSDFQSPADILLWQPAHQTASNLYFLTRNAFHFGHNLGNPDFLTDETFSFPTPRFESKGLGSFE